MNTQRKQEERTSCSRCSKRVTLPFQYCRHCEPVLAGYERNGLEYDIADVLELERELTQTNPLWSLITGIGD